MKPDGNCPNCESFGIDLLAVSNALLERANKNFMRNRLLARIWFSVFAVILPGVASSLNAQAWTPAPTAEPVVESQMGSTGLALDPLQTVGARVYPEGKLLISPNYPVINGRYGDGAWHRLNSDGSNDESFAHRAGVNILSVYPDGRILISRLRDANSTDGYIDRILASGADDPSFSPLLLDSLDRVNSELLSDGRILIFGNFTRVGTMPQRTVALIGSDGTRDSGFNSPFISVFGYSIVNSVKVTRDGLKIIIGGNNLGLSGSDVVRLNMDGSVDSGFDANFSGGNVIRVYPDVQGGVFVALAGNGGVTRLTATGSHDVGFIPHLAGSNWIFGPQQTDRKILYLALNFGGNTVRELRRMNPDGSDDATFSVISTPYASNYEVGMPLLRDDGTFYVGPMTANRKAAHLEISHVLTNGSIDTSFNPRISNYGSIRAYARFPDGKLLLAGMFDYACNTSFLGVTGMTVVRLNIDRSFNVTLPSISGNGSGISQVAVQPDGRIVLFGSFPYGNGYKSIIRLGADGSIDASFGSFTQTLYATTTDSSGNIYGYRGDTGAKLLRYSPDGVLDSAFQAPDLGLIKFSAALWDGAVLVYSFVDGIGYRFTRLLRNGAIDPGFNPPASTNVVALAALPDGNAIFGEELTDPQGSGNYYHTIRRLLPNGNIDYKYTSAVTPGSGPRDNIRLALAKAVFDLLSEASPRAEAEVTVDFSSSEELMKLSCRTDGTLLVYSFVSNDKPIRAYRLAGMASSSKVSGDFDGDGKADILWQNTGSGDHAIWVMNGTTPFTWVNLPAIALDWRIVGTGDFNGDGQTDILWENVGSGDRGIWIMNGTVPAAWINLPSIALNWRIVGTGDFNSDGMTDILWENVGSGDRGMWIMNGTVPAAWINLPSIALNWRIVGTGDFNGDGQTDILWENVGSGDRGMWIMNGTVPAAWINLPSIALNWRIAGAGDFNGDGQTDILWENESSGDRGMWIMNGTVPVAWINLPTLTLDWRIAQ